MCNCCCMIHLQDGDEWSNEDAIAAGDLHDQVKAAETGEITDMLEPPTKVNLDLRNDSRT